MGGNRYSAIPGHLLEARNVQGLLDWLDSRGWSMSLLELDQERRRRRAERRGAACRRS